MSRVPRGCWLGSHRVSPRCSAELWHPCPGPHRWGDVGQQSLRDGFGSMGDSWPELRMVWSQMVPSQKPRLWALERLTFSGTPPLPGGPGARVREPGYDPTFPQWRARWAPHGTEPYLGCFHQGTHWFQLLWPLEEATVRRWVEGLWILDFPVTWNNLLLTFSAAGGLPEARWSFLAFARACVWQLLLGIRGLRGLQVWPGLPVVFASEAHPCLLWGARSVVSSWHLLGRKGSHGDGSKSSGLLHFLKLSVLWWPVYCHFSYHGYGLNLCKEVT